MFMIIKEFYLTEQARQQGMFTHDKTERGLSYIVGGHFTLFTYDLIMRK